MLVLKFGGTSVGSADRMQEVIDIIEKNPGQQLVVLSAMSGTTNDLQQIANTIKNKEPDLASDLIAQLESKYVRVLTDLYPYKDVRDRARFLLRPSIRLIKDKLESSSFCPVDEKEILAQGEIMSTALFTLLCEVRQINVAQVRALDFIHTDQNGEPDFARIRQDLTRLLIPLEEVQVIVTQGYICKNHSGQIDNLKRGGSDYTATIIGSAIDADEIRIWTDIDGVRTNDPRIVNDTLPIRKLSYREAAELAYFGAKILHPTCVLPAEKANVPLRLKCTMSPDSPGTLISRETSKRPITAIAAKDNITAIKVYSHRMLQAYGFLRKVFQVFEDHKTSVDMITTSEVAVSLTIDDVRNLPDIVDGLSKFAEVESDTSYSIICIVGNALYDESQHVHRIFESLQEIPVRMVSMGGSRNNISLLVKTEYKVNVMRALNHLFITSGEEVYA